MKLAYRFEGDRLWLIGSSTFDHVVASCRELSQSLEHYDRDQLTLDLSEVKQANTSLLLLITHIARWCSTRQVSFSIEDVHDSFGHLLFICGMAEWIR